MKPSIDTHNRPLRPTQMDQQRKPQKMEAMEATSVSHRANHQFPYMDHVEDIATTTRQRLLLLRKLWRKLSKDSKMAQ